MQTLYNLLWQYCFHSSHANKVTVIRSAERKELTSRRQWEHDSYAQNSSSLPEAPGTEVVSVYAMTH